MSEGKSSDESQAAGGKVSDGDRAGGKEPEAGDELGRDKTLMEKVMDYCRTRHFLKVSQGYMQCSAIISFRISFCFFSLKSIPLNKTNGYPLSTEL